MPHRVLVVDDQLIQREHLRGLLKRAGASQVETAESGMQALAMLDHDAFDLVLSDLLMPGLDGIQFIQRLSLRDCHPALALMSSSPRRVIEGACLVAETLGVRVVDQISKPATPRAIHDLLGRLQSSAGLQAEKMAASEPLYDRQTLKMALGCHQIEAWYQPKVRISDGCVVAAEALARWVVPNGPVLLPVQFLPSMIMNGLEEELLMAILEQTVEAQTLWESKGHCVEVSVNLPCHMLDDRGLPDRLHARVIEMGGNPGSICFELTESSTTRTLSDLYAGVCRLRMKGFGVAQDDSGQGYSSLFNIASTPFTEIKIDRSLVSRCARNEGARAAIESMVGLGKKLGLNVVAEGVETCEQLRILRELKCDAVQGFFISGALTQELFCNFILKRTNISGTR